MSTRLTRREALSSVATTIAKPVAAAQAPAAAQGSAPPAPATPGRPRLVPREELITLLEYEAEARRVLSPTASAAVAGSERGGFELITLHTRMMVNCLNLDLTVDLFGAKLFAPVIVGPIAQQRDYHAEGELATVRGASTAKAPVIVSSRSSVPIKDIAAAAKTPLWFQIFQGDGAAGRTAAQQAIDAGCTALFITAGTPTAGGRIDWGAIDRLRAGLSVPVIVKGVTTKEDAQTAVARGIQGIVVSTYKAPVRSTTIQLLPSIVDAVNGKAVVLADGSFRRGTDAIKALAFGAKAIVIGRPVMWGLAGYGAEGVQGVIEMMQTELARTMAGSGKPSLAVLDRTLVRVHAPRPSRS